MKYRTNVLKLYLLALLFIQQGLFAQQYNFKTYSPASAGLAGNVVNCIFQDHAGFIWFGTQSGGVSKFDGKSFKNYTHSDGLGSSDVVSICEDKQGRIWLAHSVNGVSYFDGQHFETYNTENGLPSNNINSLYCDKQGVLWICTQDKGLIGLPHPNLPLKENKLILLNKSFEGGCDTVFCVIQDKKQRFWLGTTKGLLFWESKKVKIFRPSKVENQLSSAISCLMIDHRNHLIAGSFYRKIYEIDLNKSSIQMEEYPIEKGFRLGMILKLAQDNSQHIWVATGQGLLNINANNQKLLTSEHGISDNLINTVETDYEGNIWFAPQNGGAYLLRSEAFVNYNKSNGLSSNIVTATLPLSNSEVLVGTIGTGLNLLRNNVVTPLHISKELDASDIYYLFKDRSNNIWVGTSGSGVYVLNDDHGSFKVKQHFSQIDGITPSSITCIIQDKSGAIWATSLDQGVFVFYPNGKAIHLQLHNASIPEKLTGVMQDHAGKIWLTSYGGGLVSVEDGKITRTINQKTGFPDQNIFTICEHNNLFFVGTAESGLICYDPIKNKVVQQIGTKQELVSNAVSSLIFDKQGALWVGTDKGIGKITFTHDDPSTYSIKHYQHYDGYTEAEVNNNGITLDPDGSLWISTIDGLVQYRPTLDFKKSAQPEIVLTGIKLFYNNVDWTKFNNAIDPITGLPQGLHLTYNNHNLTFVFQALTTSDVKYTYFLEGLDENWSPLRNTSEAAYPNIPPGTYTFKARALNSDKRWSRNTIEFTFIISPPFYRTWWFYGISVIFSAILIYLFVQLRTRSLRKEKFKLETMVRERTTEVIKQKEIIELKNVEITDSINYAKRIQSSILPSTQKINEVFANSFVFFQPKDIVSGDFYWFGETTEYYYIAVADCTGHGVPGGFMSLIGNDQLNAALDAASNVGQLLQGLNQRVRLTLKQKETSESNHDGMDIAICSFDKEFRTLHYAGANRPLWLIRKDNPSEVHEIKATKAAIGGFTDDNQEFTTHTTQLAAGDKIYMFSDGYVDQFGVTNKKLMTKRFREYLLEIQGQPMKAQGPLLSQFIANWKGDQEQTDDILVVGIEVNEMAYS